MSRLDGLKRFVGQRLTAAVDEIFGHFERTISEFEEELRLRHRKLLEAGRWEVSADSDTKLS